MDPSTKLQTALVGARSNDANARDSGSEENSGPSSEDSGGVSHPSDLLDGRVGGALLVVVSFWVVALILPGPRVIVPLPTFFGATIVLVVLAVLPLVFLWKSAWGGTAPLGVVGTLSLSMFFLMMAAVWHLTGAWIIVFDSRMKFAFGVGGSALAALAIGLLLFRTLRVAASLPIVVLFIGVCAFPGGSEVVGDMRENLVAWMSGILGVAALAESASQIAETIQRGGVVKVVAQAPSSGGANSGNELGRTQLSNLLGPSGDLR